MTQIPPPKFHPEMGNFHSLANDGALEEAVRVGLVLPLLIAAASANTSMWYPPENRLLFHINWPFDLIIYAFATVGLAFAIWFIWPFLMDIVKKLFPARFKEKDDVR